MKVKNVYGAAGTADEGDAVNAIVHLIKDDLAKIEWESFTEHDIAIRDLDRYVNGLTVFAISADKKLNLSEHAFLNSICGVAFSRKKAVAYIKDNYNVSCKRIFSRPSFIRKAIDEDIKHDHEFLISLKIFYSIILIFLILSEVENSGEFEKESEKIMEVFIDEFYYCDDSYDDVQNDLNKDNHACFIEKFEDSNADSYIDDIIASNKAISNVFEGETTTVSPSLKSNGAGDVGHISDIDRFISSNTVAKENDEEAEQDNGVDSLELILTELDSMIGLTNVKRQIATLLNILKVNKIREERGLKIPPISLHMVFTGNPGTGKTTVARIIGRLLSSLGILSKGGFYEVDRSQLVASYVGQTAEKTKAVIEEAMGGVLFIDEAYSLSPENNGGTSDFGEEVISTLIAYMENNRDDFVVIAAGYKPEMEGFIKTNPGLKSRFKLFIDFDDYNTEELVAILNFECDKYGYISDEKFLSEFKVVIEENRKEEGEHFGNGRTVRNLFEKIIAAHSNRISMISNLSDHELRTLTVDDITNIF